MVTFRQFTACSGLFLFFIMICADTSIAQQNDHQLKAEQLLILTGVPNTLVQVSIIAIDVQLQEEPQLKKYEDIFRSFVAQHTSWDALKPDLIRLYTDNFTEKEIVDLIRFYSSPTGKKSIELSPHLMNQTSLLVQNVFMKNGAQLDKMIHHHDQKYRAEAADHLKSLD